MASKLNDRQRIFVREYRIDRNATRAAKAAGYSEKTAHVIGCRLLKNVQVEQEIRSVTEKRLEKLELTGDRVINELALLGFSNMQDYIKTNGEGDVYVSLAELDRDKAAAIQEVVIDHYVDGHGETAREVKRTRFKLADKGINLERLGKHFGVFNKDNELNVKFDTDPDSALAKLFAGAVAKHSGAAVSQ